MSLSEWDVLSLDQLGRPSNGASEPSPAGVTVDIHENYLKLTGAELWHPMSAYQKPQVGVFRTGDMNLLDVFVLAKATARGGLIWATWFYRGAEVIGTVGVVAYGFSQDQDYVGVKASDVAEMTVTLSEWVAQGRMPPALGELGTANALRYNQGDDFFARQMGHALSATPPGKAELPTLYHANPNMLKSSPADEPVKSPVKLRPRKKAATPSPRTSKNDTTKKEVRPTKAA